MITLAVKRKSYANAEEQTNERTRKGEKRGKENYVRAVVSVSKRHLRTAEPVPG
jgi:hypothetical protein